MKHIEKISISNARRFGENIEIEFGEGATIILAPNGTGKTTVFEAIELALTRQIKRLEKYPDAIIRDGFSEMDVRLDFSEGKYCYVNHSKGGKSECRGDYDKLFEVEDESSISYLFRLTHFLEQRGKEWFVEQDDNVAGDIINKLPIGKDLRVITSKKASLIRAVGIAEANAFNSLKEATEMFNRFDELRSKRNKLVNDDKLQPLESIISRLVLISKLVNGGEYKEEYVLESVNTYFESVKISCKQMDSHQNDLLIKLNSLNDRTHRYYSNLEEIARMKVALNAATNVIADINLNIEELNNSFEAQEKSISKLEIKIKKLEAEKSMFDQHEIKEKQLNIDTTELGRLEFEKTNFVKSSEEIIERLKKEARNNDQYITLKDRIGKEKRLLREAENKKSLLKQWENIQSTILEITEKVMPEINNRKNECLKIKIDADNKVEIAGKFYATSNKILISLNNTASIIQESVSNIKRTLSEGQRKCPVCQSDFDPAELIRRIDSSLNTLNPEVIKAIEEEKVAINNLNEAKNKQEIEGQNLKNFESEIEEKQSLLKSHKNVISEEIMPQFPECDNIEEATVYINDVISETNIVICELESDLSGLKSCIEDKDLEVLKLEKNELERTISEVSAKITALTKQIENTKIDLHQLDENLKSKKKETVFKELTSKTESLISLKEKLSSLESDLSKKKYELRKKQDYISKEDESVSVIKGIQDGIVVEWTQAELLGEPNKEVLKSRLKKVKDTLEEIKNAFEQLDEVEKQLSNWRVAQMYSNVDSEIRKIIGVIDEDIYAKELKKSVEKKKAVLEKISERKEAISLFLDKVVEESHKVNEQLESINEPWKKLLERIVINPLISKAPLLGNTISYNKTKAKTSAIINQENIDISSVASEAQITDLQLTLMLAMANKYKWTAWNGLLLDDPTQHHDLVHASSVFDVLRDYIIDYDYQVMMSTHDSSQARFFQRKLENEGIPVKVYQLIPRNEGVIAKRIS